VLSAGSNRQVVLPDIIWMVWQGNRHPMGGVAQLVSQFVKKEVEPSLLFIPLRPFPVPLPALGRNGKPYSQRGRR
jgi:hypothetical protein